MSCKLYLVPEDVINTWRAEQRESAVDKPLETVAAQVDSGMDKILHEDIPDYEKEKLFSQELSKYLSLRNQKNTVQEPPPPIPDISMTSIPKMYRNKAAGLLQFLQSDKDISWDDEGHLTIGQQKIDNSHVLDLIHDAIRLRKKVGRAKGWRELSGHLRKRNVPKELVGNPEWFTPPNSPEKLGIKRKPDFEPYSKTPVTSRKKRVFGIDLPNPMSVKKARKSKLLGQKKIKQWISV